MCIRDRWVSSQADLYFNATRIGGAPPQPTRTGVSLSAALPRNRTSAATRIVGCTVIGEDPQTRLPITISAVSKVLLNGALPWQDFEYPIRTKPCIAAGCINTVARDLDDGGGPGLLLAAGPAVNLPGAGNRDALFVRVQGSSEGLLQVVPIANATQNLTEAVYSEASLINLPSAFPGLTGWQVDGQGRMYITGEMEDGRGNSPFIAALDFSSPLGGYNTTGKYQRLEYPGSPCVSSRTRPRRAIFGGLTSAWLEPSSGALFVADSGCTNINRVEALVLDPTCTNPSSCGYIDLAINYFPLVDTGNSFGLPGKVRAGCIMMNE